MIVIIVELLILVLTVSIFFIRYKSNMNRKMKEFLEKVPGPPGMFLLGNMLEFRSPQEILTKMQRYMAEYPGNFKVVLGLDPYIVANDYKFLEFVMSSNKLITKSPDYDNMKSWLGTGLLTSTDKKWHQRRKIITPAFHFKILEQFMDVFERAGNILVNKLQENNNSPSLDVYPLVSLCTLDVICETAMGTSVNAQIQNDSEYVSSVKRMGRIFVENIYSVVRVLPFLYPLMLRYYSEKAALKILHRYTTNIIETRKNSIKYDNSKNVGEEKVDDDSLGIKKKKAFLDLLLNVKVDGQALDDVDIREEVDTFMFEVENCQKLLKEQSDIFGEDLKNASNTYQTLQQMKYLELVIKETLRLYPSVPYIGRKATSDIEYDGMVIPAGINIGIFSYAIQRNPKFYSDPEKFDPNRFEKMDGTRPYIYIPFSAGPRNCIGQKFAMMEMKSVLSKIVRRFELTAAIPRHDPQLVAELILKSANGIRISIKGRVYK